VPPDTVSAQEAADLAAVRAETFQGPVGSSNEDLDDELEAFLGAESDAILAEEVGIDIPIVMNERVLYFIDYFQHRVRRSFEKWLARGSRTVPYLKERFRDAGLPEDLVYLSLIESGFSPRATSRANAVGYWQFIAPTARRYGLRVDSWVDERRDLERSTDAAIAYLQDLHRMFGSWYLAAAAYNSGEGRIQRAIDRYGSENLWELSEFSYLREETKNYVPKLIAATLIVKEPEKYGFGDVPELPELETDVVTVETQTDLEVIAAAAGSSVETIRTLNPHLRSWATPPGARDFEVHVPDGSADLFRARYAALPPSQRVLVRRHTVRRGETPSAIARRYGVSTQALMAANGIRDARRLRVGQQLTVPRAPGAGRGGDLPEVLARIEEIPAPQRAGASPPALEDDGEAVYGGGAADADRVADGGEAAGAEDAGAAGEEPPAELASAGGPAALPAHGPSWSSADAAGATPDVAGATPDVARATPDIVRATPDVARATPDVTRATPDVAGVTAPGQPSGPASSAAARTGLPPDEAAAVGPSETSDVSEVEAPPPAPPAPPPAGRRPARTITVRAGEGDTLHRIARDHGVTVAEMERWNPQAVSGVTPGMVLRIEGGGAAAPAARDEATERPGALARAAGGEPGDRLVHRVRRGETLWSIAQRYGVSVAQVREWNDRRGSAIRAGERLVIFR
jgi:LysM repeat protein